MWNMVNLLLKYLLRKPARPRAIFALAAAIALLCTGLARAEEARRGMVVAAQHEASAAGLDILKAGGNAVDAAVAVGYALAVVDPCCGNIGGGGFMLIRRRRRRRTASINFREKAPRAATARHVSRRLPARSGARGEPLRLSRGRGARHGHGARPRAARNTGGSTARKVMAPAIALARDGFVLGAADAAIIAAQRRAARRATRRRRASFCAPTARRYRAGDRLVQPDLAATLALIAERGAGGVLSRPDRRTRSPPPRRRMAADPDRGRISPITTRPSRAGRLRLSRLPDLVGAAAERRRHDAVRDTCTSSPAGISAHAGYRSPRAMHLMAETMRHAYLDRNTALGDPDFVADPRPRLLSPEHAAAIRAAIDPGEGDARRPRSAPASPPHEAAETTHYSVVDGEGNAVAVTYTLNGNFGAAVVAPGTGFLLNNEMDDFTVKPGAPNLFGLVQGEANAIAPGKRPLSSMTPDHRRTRRQAGARARQSRAGRGSSRRCWRR